MALETGTYVSDLVDANPADTDPRSQGAGHLRLIKSLIKATFPNITGAVTATHTDLNWLGEAGHRVLFQQSTPPTGWTKVTTGTDNRALRIVSGSVGSGGGRAFTAAFNESNLVSDTSLTTNSAGAHDHGGTESTALTVAQLPSHSHSYSTGTSDLFGNVARTGSGSQIGAETDEAGGGEGHSHNIPSDGEHTHSVDAHNHSFNLDVQYLDVIVAEKD